MTAPERLVIFSGVPHTKLQEVVVAHGGFVKEVAVWATLFRKVMVVCPISSRPAPADAIQYAHNNIEFLSLGEPFVSEGIIGKAKLLLAFIQWSAVCLREISPSDVLMARGPDGIGFLGWVLSRLRGNLRFAKYADQWANYPREPIGYRVQKAAYRSPAFGGPVLMYGEPNSDAPHLIPTFPSSISTAEWEAAGTLIAHRPDPPPFRLVFVGRFVKDKGVDVLLRAFRILRSENLQLALTIVGGGPEASNIACLIKELDLGSEVELREWMGWNELQTIYARSHLYIHCARKEGFGKVLLEGMTFGLPIIGTNVGVSLALIEETQSGILYPPGDVIGLVNSIKWALADPVRLSEMGENGRATSRNLVLEKLGESLSEFLENSSCSHRTGISGRIDRGGN